MKTNNLVQDKSFDFAVRIIQAYQFLINEKKEYSLSKQLLKSGRSVGANIEEAIGGYSTPDFLHKLGIFYKECRETIYWLRLLQAADYFTAAMAGSLVTDARSICRILAKIQLTVKGKEMNKRLKVKD